MVLAGKKKEKQKGKREKQQQQQSFVMFKPSQQLSDRNYQLCEIFTCGNLFTLSLWGYGGREMLMGSG